MIAEEYFSLQVTRVKSTEDWVYQREGFTFLIFKAGVGRYVAEDMVVQTAPGDVLILTRGTKGNLRAIQGDEVVFLNFSLCLEHLFPLFASNEIALLEDVVGGLKNAKLLPAADPLTRQVGRLIGEISPEFNLNHRGQLLRVAAAILTEEFKNAHQRRAGFVKTEDRIVQVFNKLSTNELLNLSIAELAEKFGCSRRHLSRLSHQYLGRSIAKLKMETRLLKAAACLRNPEAKIINVAEQCGFNHLGLFNNCFKRRFGASPGKWRNMTAGKPDTLADDTDLAVPSSEPGSARFLLHIANENGKQTHAFPVTSPVQSKNAGKAREPKKSPNGSKSVIRRNHVQKNGAGRQAR